MENKRVKFPIATIFLILSSLVFIIAPFFYSVGFIYILLPIISNIVVCIFLFKKEINKVFLLATASLMLHVIFWINRCSNLFLAIMLFAGVLLEFIIAAEVIPQLSKCKDFTKKLYFIPAVLFLVLALWEIITDFYFGMPQIIFLTEALTFYFLANWCVNPLEDVKNIEKHQTNEYDFNKDNNCCLDYNESYCELVKHILLSLFTFGIWMLIWIYKTTKALNKAPNSEKYDPTKKLLLCMFVPFYMIYWFYKHAEKIDKLNAVAGNKTDNTTMYLLLGIFIPVVACILMQDNINKLCVANTNVESSINSEVSVRAPAKDEKNTAEALKEYKSLLDMGVITQEEFEAKKKQLLGL